ncbi:MAG: hypothetical protein ACI915_002585 [Gammaproteobacteria bacterium]|jgi:hypothetical protein
MSYRLAGFGICSPENPNRYSFQLSCRAAVVVGSVNLKLNLSDVITERLRISTKMGLATIFRGACLDAQR